MTKEIAHVNVVALTPAEMVPAQASLVAWCGRKVQALEDEVAELELHHKLATENGWRTSVVTASLNRAAKRVTYYENMRVALEAGYLMVPNMPVDVLAVRVKRDAPVPQRRDSQWGGFAARPQAGLPAGEGRYVDDALKYQDLSHVNTKDGKQVHVREYLADEYDEGVDFPISLTKPVVLDAVARAMALKVFDRIGRVQNGGGRDPIYVGQLLDPRGNGRMTTFFLAWWVDTTSL